MCPRVLDGVCYGESLGEEAGEGKGKPDRQTNPTNKSVLLTDLRCSKSKYRKSVRAL